MKTQILTLACMFGLAMLGGAVLAGNPPSASTHTAPTRSVCGQDRQKCESYMLRNSPAIQMYCEQHPQDARCVKLKQNLQEAKKAYCEQHPRDPSCEKSKQNPAQNKNTKPDSSPPPGA